MSMQVRSYGFLIYNKFSYNVNSLWGTTLTPQSVDYQATWMGYQPTRVFYHQLTHCIYRTTGSSGHSGYWIEIIHTLYWLFLYHQNKTMPWHYRTYKLLIRGIIMEKTIFSINFISQVSLYIVTKKGEEQHAVINLKALTNASCQGGPLQDRRVTLPSRHTRD